MDTMRKKFWKPPYRAISVAMLSVLSMIAGSCGELPGAEKGSGSFLGSVTPPATSLSGYIAVAESTNRSVMLFDDRMNFVRYLYLGPAGVTTEIPFAINMFDADRIMILIDGNDRVVINSLTSPSALGSMLISDVTNLAIATRGGIARLSNGDVLIAEYGTNTIERYTSSGVRNASGWPLASLTGLSGIDAITTGVAAGGHVHCGITADQARTVNANGTTLFTSATLAGHDFVDCVAHTDGRIAAALNGATDRVRIYTDYTMASYCDYISATLLVNPLTLDFKPNGNILVWDGTNRTMLEINSACALVASYSSDYLTPVTVTDMIVVP
jgi:hypothetical protein